MKKILSLMLAIMMLVSAIPAAYATTAYTNGTQVEYIADVDANREYTITVPALLNPGQSGTVTLKGKWASNETVKVTADATVELTNSINSNDKKVLNISFAGIEKAGDNTVERTYTENVSVAAMPSDALFGVWSGKFNYNVDYVAGSGTTDPSDPDQPGGGEEISFAYRDVTFKAYAGETWGEYVARDAFGDFMSIKDNVVIMDDFYFLVNDKGENQYADTVIVDGMTYSRGPSVGEEATVITFTIDGTEYQAEEGMTFDEWVESEYNTDGFRLDFGTYPAVLVNSKGIQVLNNNNSVYKTDTIQNATYTTLITFTIDGTQYQAEVGMTWTKWCASEYNTDGYYVHTTSGGPVKRIPAESNNFYKVFDSSDAEEKGYSTILNGETYTLVKW